MSIVNAHHKLLHTKLLHPPLECNSSNSEKVPNSCETWTPSLLDHSLKLMLKLEGLEQWHAKLQISTIHNSQIYNIEHQCHHPPSSTSNLLLNVLILNLFFSLKLDHLLLVFFYTLMLMSKQKQPATWVPVPPLVVGQVLQMTLST